MVKFDPGDLIMSPQIEDKFNNVKDYKKELLQSMFLYIVGVWEDKNNDDVNLIIAEALKSNGKLSTSYETTQGRIKVTTYLSKNQTILEFEGEDYESTIK